MAPNHGVTSMLLTNITNALFINKWMKYNLINNWSPVSLFSQVQWKKISGKPLQSRFWHQAIYVYKCINLYKIAEKMFHWLQNRKWAYGICFPQQSDLLLSENLMMLLLLEVTWVAMIWEKRSSSSSVPSICIRPLKNQWRLCSLKHYHLQGQLTAGKGCFT